VWRNANTACDVVGNGNDSRNHANTPAAAVNESHAGLPPAAVSRNHADLPLAGVNRNHANTPSAAVNGSHAGTLPADNSDVFIAGNSKRRHAYDLRPAAVRRQPNRIRRLILDSEPYKVVSAANTAPALPDVYETGWEFSSAIGAGAVMYCTEQFVDH
jgi:hypothetical protein